MHKDPCRRFVLGATIEDTSVRLWFCNRAMIIASEQFDINRVCSTTSFHHYIFIVYILGCQNIDQIDLVSWICG